MENEYGQEETLNPEENSELETNTENAESEELKKAQELANNYKIRAEKAEALAKQLKPQPVKKEESETPKISETVFSPKDYLALSQNNVSADDFDEVQDYANFKKISIAEALKSPYVLDSLKRKTEERATAAATNVGGGKKVASKNTPEAILERAESGQLPEDEEGIKALSEARLQSRIEAAKEDRK